MEFSKDFLEPPLPTFFANSSSHKGEAVRCPWDYEMKFGRKIDHTLLLAKFSPFSLGGTKDRVISPQSFSIPTYKQFLCGHKLLFGGAVVTFLYIIFPQGSSELIYFNIILVFYYFWYFYPNVFSQNFFKNFFVIS